MTRRAKRQTRVEIARNRVPDHENDTRKAFLQLRWEKAKGSALDDGKRRFDEDEWFCHYELVVPLSRWDIRRDDGEDDGNFRDEQVSALKPPTIRGGGSGHVPCDNREGGYHYDTPYRDGVHAHWDAALLGGLEIFVIAPDGTRISKPDPAPN